MPHTKLNSKYTNDLNIKKQNMKPGTVTQACNPSTLGGWGGQIMRSRDRDHPGQHGETPSLLKIQKISWAQWRVPIIPAAQEAEAGELPEPRRRRLRWAEIAPVHSSLVNKSKTPSQTNKQTNKQTGIWLGLVAHTYNPSTLGGRCRWITWGQQFDTSFKMVKPVSTKNTKKILARSDGALL